MILNGGLRTGKQVVKHLEWADGVMLGREAYHRPMLLAEVSLRSVRRRRACNCWSAWLVTPRASWRAANG